MWNTITISSLDINHYGQVLLSVREQSTVRVFLSELFPNFYSITFLLFIEKWTHNYKYDIRYFYIYLRICKYTGYCWSFYSFDDEDEVGVGRNGTDGSASIGSCSRAQDFNFLVHIQVNTNFIPTFDDLPFADPEGKWLSSLVAWIELSAIS